MLAVLGQAPNHTHATFAEFCCMSGAGPRGVSNREIVLVGGTKQMKKIRTSLGVSSLVLSVVLATLAVAPLMAQDWPMFGQDLTNSANASQTNITQGNVRRLAPKWIFTTGGDVSARAAVVNDVVYFPDWGGNLWAVDASTGKTVWTHTLSHYGFPSGTISRTSPAVVDGKVYIGTQGGWLLAIN